MNKTAIKNFAIWARNRLIADIKYRAGLMGVTENGIANALPQSSAATEFYDIGTAEPYAINGEEIKQRRALVEVIRAKEKDSDYAVAYKYIIEEVSYTWFNRLIAVRFMEVNDYLPSHMRVLSSESGKTEPDIVTNPFDAELNLTSAEEEKIIALKRENKLDEAFRMLFIKQCNTLNEILPALFEKTSDYTELLLNLSVIDQDGVVYHLVHDIPEEDFNVNAGGQVEIVGWMYQYYNTDNFNLVYDGNMSRVKISKDFLPAATQLFTPDWVVKQMCENAICPMVFEKIDHEKYKYCVESEGRNLIKIEEVKILDPSMGSGHFLVYAFDILLDAYTKQGYGKRDAVRVILEKNLYGLDIDKRAFQLAYFSLLMKARSYDRKILSRKIKMGVSCFVALDNQFIEAVNQADFISTDEKKILTQLYREYCEIDEIGSICKESIINTEELVAILQNIEEFSTDNIIDYSYREIIKAGLTNVIQQHYIMNTKYDVVVTNPPYLGNSRMSPVLLKYVTDKYKDAKADLSMAFYEKSYSEFLKEYGRISFLTTTSWMYLSTYEMFRSKMINSMSFSLLVEFGTELFEGKIGHLPIVSWCCVKGEKLSCMKAIRLVKFCYKDRIYKETEYFNERNRYEISQDKFMELPSFPIAYWLHEDFYRLIETKQYYIENIVTKKAGIVTGNDKYFIRYWFEIELKDIDFSSNCFEVGNGKKYNIIAKGGSNRQYYGNFEYVIKLQDLWNPQKTNVSVRRGDSEFYLKTAIGWSQIGNSQKTFRLIENAVCGTATPTIYLNDDKYLYYVLAYLNSKICKQYLDVFNPTLNLMSTDICNLPIIIDESKLDIVNRKTQRLVELYKNDWNSGECSWDFVAHPYIIHASMHSIEKIEECLINERDEIRTEILSLQNELDTIFSEICRIDISNVRDEKSVNLREFSIAEDVKSFISYAVGCMFGRYNLGKEKVFCTNSEFDYASYESFAPDSDNIIPINDEEYFKDDIVQRFIDFLRIAFGTECLDDNLHYIANNISDKNMGSGDIIREYFIKSFYSDHVKMYQNTPIYWLFDSGKQNGFKALIYMNRYTVDTIGNVRVDYLHRIQRVYESEIGRMLDTIDNSKNSREVSLATKRKEKLQKQLKECREYDEKIGHLALARIELDLDDGVKVNYRKVQSDTDGKFYEILADSKKIMAKEK